MLGDVLRYVEQEEQRALGHDGAHDLRLRRCRGDAGEIQGEYRGDTGEMQGVTARTICAWLADQGQG